MITSLIEMLELPNFQRWGFFELKDTHRENAPSNKTQTLEKGINMEDYINYCTIGRYQLFIKGSYSEIKFAENKVVSGKASFFVIGSICIPQSISRNINFQQVSCCVFNRRRNLWCLCWL